MNSWNEEIKKELGGCGTDVFIGHNVMFTDPKAVFLGNRVRIDPFTLITAGLVTGNNIQICSHVVMIGGGQKVIMGDWTFAAYGSKIITASEDQNGDFGPVNNFWGENKVNRGDVTLKNFSGISADVIVMSGVTIPEGCTIGAQSLVYRDRDLLPWSVFWGNPLKFRKNRNKESVIAFSKDPDFLKRTNFKRHLYFDEGG